MRVRVRGGNTLLAGVVRVMGERVKGGGGGTAANTLLTAVPPCTTAAMPSFNSCIPGAPAPDAAWYVLMMARLILYFLWMGQSAMRAMAVVQLGLAISFFPLAAAMLISGITNGTASLYRKADELSMTSTPAAASFSAHSKEKSPPTASNTTSSWDATSYVKGSIVNSPYLLLDTVLPADFSDANSFNAVTGKLRFSMTDRISSPTAPVAPTIPTLTGRLAIIVGVRGEMWRRRWCIADVGRPCRKPVALVASNAVTTSKSSILFFVQIVFFSTNLSY